MVYHLFPINIAKNSMVYHQFPPLVLHHFTLYNSDKLGPSLLRQPGSPRS